MKCSVCPFETDVREKLAGHMSGHVRRGECAKRVQIVKTGEGHTCLKCGRKFDSGPALGGHLQSHIEFDQIKRDGTRKRRLIVERGHQCETCHNAEWMGSLIPLTLDHIDGNVDNNDVSNLRLLCPNCHAQTPTFCGKNVGRFPITKRSAARGKHYVPASLRNSTE